MRLDKVKSKYLGIKNNRTQKSIENVLRLREAKAHHEIKDAAPPVHATKMNTVFSLMFHGNSNSQFDNS